MTVQIKKDLYPEETSWKIRDADGNVVMRRKEFKDTLSLHKNTKCLPKTNTCLGSDYTFATGGSDFNYEKPISLCRTPSGGSIEKRKTCTETDGCFWCPIIEVEVFADNVNPELGRVNVSNKDAHVIIFLKGLAKLAKFTSLARYSMMTFIALLGC